VLEELAQESSFALIVMTAEDERADGDLSAPERSSRGGPLQGRPGSPRTIMGVEERGGDCSNVRGFQQVRFSPGKIKEVFGEVLAKLRREFSATQIFDSCKRSKGPRR